VAFLSALHGGFEISANRPKPSTVDGPGAPSWSISPMRASRAEMRKLPCPPPNAGRDDEVSGTRLSSRNRSPISLPNFRIEFGPASVMQQINVRTNTRHHDGRP